MKVTALLVAAASAQNAEKRLNKISRHMDTLLDLMENNTTASVARVGRANAWVTKLLSQAGQINATLCATVESIDEAGDALVFDQESYCKLTGQVQTALRSYVRTFGCPETYPKKNFEAVFAKRTNRVKNIFSRAGDC
ncbi:Oidioi.mRNA.OKI2018_I69.chr1.g3491.t1.cds [Oikopleura dioica]|uniref:Oidioi.mRNA.OKI2018_I69.chr1.g3491.t1.cds n=1 Tax=Oikopleura dioica TaxID=34765 RepID=A0ABN7SUB5_OIKDI|nr:Oidioi.mRNA.OKI2018_I69.chr1.g3491.t1.cds [Oikopleura dioica]